MCECVEKLLDRRITYWNVHLLVSCHLSQPYQRFNFLFSAVSRVEIGWFAYFRFDFVVRLIDREDRNLTIAPIDDNDSLD